MKQYGYDPLTGHTFSLERDFQYEGVFPSAPSENCYVAGDRSEDRLEDEIIGCAFLSGWKGTFLAIHSVNNPKRFLFGFEDCMRYWRGPDINDADFKRLSYRMPICVSGGIVANSEQMAALCSEYPHSRIYACPIVDELIAFGVLARNISGSPYRVNWARDNNETIDADSIKYDPVLDGDGFGRMADLVAHDLLCDLMPVNEIKTTIGLSPFYGKVLHKKWIKGSQIIVRIEMMDELFPNIPISAKNYAATSVPVKMETTSQFSELTGYNEPFADVFVATDYVPGVSVFMRFYKTLSGRGFVFTSDQGNVQHGPIVPVFRGNMAYRVLREKYEQTKRLV